MAYLDIWDIISERGFCEGDGSGEEVKGMLGFMVLEVLLAGAEELLRGPAGREPASKRKTSLGAEVKAALFSLPSTQKGPVWTPGKEDLLHETREHARAQMSPTPAKVHGLERNTILTHTKTEHPRAHKTPSIP